jgi:hypothetical protein
MKPVPKAILKAIAIFGSVALFGAFLFPMIETSAKKTPPQPAAVSAPVPVSAAIKVDEPPTILVPNDPSVDRGLDQLLKNGVKQ